VRLVDTLHERLSVKRITMKKAVFMVLGLDVNVLTLSGGC
jgi:hypothetical protein